MRKIPASLDEIAGTLNAPLVTQFPIYTGSNSIILENSGSAKGGKGKEGKGTFPPPKKGKNWSNFLGILLPPEKCLP